MAVQYAFGKIITQGLDLNVDAADPTSYPGSGTAWTSVVNRSITGSVVSCSFSSDFKGGIVFDNPSASVEFPGTLANYGTGSFTVEMAFRPSYIEGIHYLVSKNSGSYPNWGVYLSGSGGSGKLFAEYNIDASVSCSVSSSTTFETGSSYFVDVRILPGDSVLGFYVDGASILGGTGNGTGSLVTTASFFIGNTSPSSSEAFSGIIFSNKVYSVNSLSQPATNYNNVAPRLGKSFFAYPPKVFELLIVAGGGGGTAGYGGGGGAGGLQYISNFSPTTGITQVITGAGGATGTPGAKGQNSTFGTYLSFGGGAGAGGNGGAFPAVRDGGSGGGGGYGGGTPGTGVAGQGNAGGISSGGVNSAGGGGAGQSGRDYNDPINPYSGGSGSYIASFAAIGGSPAGWFAGGGGGGGTVGAGGIGGGGTGGSGIGQTGSTNTGGGGGGGGAGGAAGGAGGSGIVAIRYNGVPIALGGEITQSEGYTYHVFRTVGTSSFTVF